MSPSRYWDTLLEILWPRFEHILELNIQSIQSTDPQKLGFLDTRPHYVRGWGEGRWGGFGVPPPRPPPSPRPPKPPLQITRRYAEFSSAIVSINQTFPNEKTHALLGQLQVLGGGGGRESQGPPRTFWGDPNTPFLCVFVPHPQVEVENFVLRVAAEFSSRKEQLIFLINNYDMMLGVLMVTSPPKNPLPPPKTHPLPPNFKEGGAQTVCPPPMSPPGAGGGGEQRGGGLPAAPLCAHPGERPPSLYIFGVPPSFFGVPPFNKGVRGSRGGGGDCHRALPQEFIEEILSPPFGGMIAFVKEAEALLEKGQLERLRGEEGKQGEGTRTNFGGPPPHFSSTPKGGSSPSFPPLPPKLG